ncbi:MAG: hypothetical protein N2254_09355 [bacterium]|nr:hypothetical protein [bacterium]
MRRIKIVWFFFFAVLVKNAYSYDFSLSGYFQNFVVFKTDKDFDPSESIYEPWGQTAGAIGTYTEPRLKFSIGETIIAAEPLLGFNVWSRNSPFSRPDQEERSQLIFLLRQLYSETKFSSLKVRAGYQYFADPIGIFLRFWIGGANFKFGNFRLFLGQIPDQTFEGLDIFSNNFINDTFVLSFDFIQKSKEEDINVLPMVQSGFFAGIYNVLDNSIVRKPLFVSNIVAGYGYDTDDLNITAGVALQGGVKAKSSQDLKSETIVAGAFEVSAVSKGQSPVGGEIMFLSPDNSKYRDGINTAFLYSGKSLSRTILLTEDEIIFKSDNLDLNVGEKVSVFQNIRPGFIVADVWTELSLSDSWKITPLIGGAFSLIKENSSTDDSFLSNFFGLEFTPIISYRKDNIIFDFANVFFVPGDASLTFLNSINPYEKRTFIWSVDLSLRIVF